MADRSIVVRIRAQVETFRSAMRKSGEDAKQLGDELEKSSKRGKEALDKTGKAAKDNSKALDDLGNRAGLAGAAISAGLAFGVKAFADFDQAMSGVAAALPEAAGEMDKLRELAIKLGGDTQFSATEAAQGITELGKAGVDAADILNGGLAGALALAAAGQIDVAEAAETAASAMTQFKLQGDDVGHIADLLAAGAGKAQGSVHDLGMALNQAGLVASQTGLSIEETTGGLAAFASAGLIGSDSGTSFKTMLQRLTPQSDAAKAQFEALGISAYDASGQFVGLSNFAGQLQTAMKDLTPEARNAALQVMFGSDAIRAAAVLYDQGADGIQKWIDKTNDVGFAAEQAAKLTDNWRGDLERLGGSLDSVLIKNGSGANAVLRSITKTAEDAVDAFGNLPGPVQGTVLALTGAVGVGLLLAGGYAKALVSVRNLRESLTELGPAGTKAAKGLDAAGKAAGYFAKGIAAVSAAALVSSLGDDRPTVGLGKLTNSLLGATDASDALSKAWKDSSVRDDGFDDPIVSLGDALNTTFNTGVVGKIDDVGGSLFETFGGTNLSNMAFARTRLEELDGALAQLVQGGHAQDAEAIFADLATEAQKQGFSIDQLKQVLPGYGDALAAVEAQSKVTADATSDTAGALDDVSVSAEAAQTKIDAVKDAILGLADATLDQRGAIRDMEAAIDDAQQRAAKFGELQKDLAKAQSDAAADRAKAQKDADADLKKAKTPEDRTRINERLADAKKRINDQLADSEKRIREELEKYNHTLDVNTEAGRANQASLDAIVQNTKKAVAETYNVTGSTEKATATMQRGRDEFIKTAQQMGLSKDAATKLADQLKLIPSNVSSIITLTGATEAELAAQKVKAAMDALHDKTVHLQTILTTQGAKNATDIMWLRDTFAPGSADGNLFANDGGRMVKAFASGGFAGTIGQAQPQIQANRGPRGIMWAETGAGPWEAFISGHPGKAERSRAIASEVVSRLGGMVDWQARASARRFADGGMLMVGSTAPSSHSETHDNRIEKVTVIAPRDFDDFQRQIEQRQRRKGRSGW